MFLYIQYLNLNNDYYFFLELRSGEGESDQLLCIHLPDYTSAEVGPVMSLLYYGEVWLCETYIRVYEVRIIGKYYRFIMKRGSLIQ